MCSGAVLLLWKPDNTEPSYSWFQNVPREMGAQFLNQLLHSLYPTSLSVVVRSCASKLFHRTFFERYKKQKQKSLRLDAFMSVAMHVVEGEWPRDQRM